MNRVLVFGVFDRLHEGHLYLLKQARQEGQLVVVVARDSSVLGLKGQKPEENQGNRIKKIQATGLASEVLLGDIEEGQYAVLKEAKPDIICLGYDQKELGEDLESKMLTGELPKIKIKKLKAYLPDTMHTSIRRRIQEQAKPINDLS